MLPARKRSDAGGTMDTPSRTSLRSFFGSLGGAGSTSPTLMAVPGGAPLLKGIGKIESFQPGDRRLNYFSAGRYSNQSKSAGRVFFCPLPVAYRPMNTPVNPPMFSEDKSRVNAVPSFFAGPFAGEQENS